MTGKLVIPSASSADDDTLVKPKRCLSQNSLDTKECVAPLSTMPTQGTQRKNMPNFKDLHPGTACMKRRCDRGKLCRTFKGYTSSSSVCMYSIGTQHLGWTVAGGFGAWNTAERTANKIRVKRGRIPSFPAGKQARGRKRLRCNPNCGDQPACEAGLAKYHWLCV